jgi:hypothetical protein
MGRQWGGLREVGRVLEVLKMTCEQELKGSKEADGRTSEFEEDES